MKYGLFVCLALIAGLAIYLYPTLYPSQRVVRPVAGDEIRPIITPVGQWRAGSAAQFEIRLSASGGAAPELLTDVEVPAELLPKVRVRFYHGEQELPHVDCKVERAC